VYEGASSSPNPEARLAAYRDFFRPFRRLAMNEDIAD
jgi:hypothetical protein